MKRKIAIFAFASSILFSACSTDFEVIGDWKETTVVYGLLDQAQDTQYIKINKAFLGEGNAFDYAMIKDSVQYVNSMSVTIQRIRNGAVVRTYTLSPDNSRPKDPGAFYSADQSAAIYSFASVGLDQLNEDSQYKLIIHNNETSNEVTSQTGLVHDCTFNAPNPLSPAPFIFFNPSDPNQRFFFKVKTGAFGRIYQTIVRFHYTDSTTTGNYSKTLDWYSAQQTTEGLDGGEILNFDFLGEDFYRFVGSSLSDYSGLYARTAGSVDLIVISAADDLNTFINVNRPSTSIIQEKPEYTNITNGLGIFSARMYKDPFTRNMNANSINALSTGPHTCSLKFLKVDGTWPGCL